jgi:DNA-binding MarR family transcriptional regulator
VTADDLATWSALVAVYQGVLHDVVSALEDDAGIDSGMFSVLAHLARADAGGSLPLSDLQQLIHPRYSQPGLSRLVQRMEGAGLLERKVSSADGRAVTVALTRRGRTRYDRANTIYNDAVHKHFGAFVAPAERTRLHDDLEQVLTRRTASATTSHSPARRSTRSPS